MTVYYTNFYPDENTTGKKGSAAFSTLQTAFVQLYKSSATIPVYPTDTPTADVVYNFTTNAVSGMTNGWDDEIGAGIDPVYVISATISSSDSTYNILPTEWSTPILYIPNTSNAITLELSNDNVTVPADFDGSNPVLTGATTEISLYDGTVEVTGLWTVTPTPSGGVTGTFVANVYTVTGFTVDSGSVSFEATRLGYPTKTIVFSISKAKAGEDGTPATIYSISTSTGTIKRSAAGGYDPSTLTMEAYSVTGVTPRILYAGRFKVYTSNDGVSYTLRYTSSVDQDTYVYTLIAAITHVKIELYKAGGTATLVDYEIIPVVEDGADLLNAIMVPSSRAVQAYVSGAVYSYAPAWYDFVLGAGGTTFITSNFTFSVISNPSSLTYTWSGTDSNRLTITGGFDSLALTEATMALRATGTGAYLGLNFDRTINIYKITIDYNPSNNSNGTALVNPVVASDGSALTSVDYPNGIKGYTFNWTWSGTETDIDGFIVTKCERASAAAYTFGASPADETHWTIDDPSKRSWPHLLSNPNFYTTYFVRAFRNVYKNISANQLLTSSAVKSTASGQNPIPPYTSNITSNINGETASNVSSGVQAAMAGLTAVGEVKTGKVLTTSIAAESVTKNGFTNSTGATNLTTSYQDIGSYTFMISSGDLLITAGYLLNCVPTSSSVTFGAQTYIELTGSSNSTVTGDVMNITSYSSSISSRVEQEVSFSQLFTALNSDTITITLYCKKYDSNTGASSATKKRINYDQLKR